MESLLIKGGVPLHGEVTISGAKNAVLPIMAATLLTEEPCVIRRVPNLSDVKFMAKILEWLGATVKIKGDTVEVHAKKINGSGVKILHGAEHEVIPDRIEAATYAFAAVATNGEVTLRGARADHMHAVLDKLHDCGVKVDRKGSAFTVSRNGFFFLFV